MTAIVNGHGRRDDDEKTFIPVGHTLHFYAGFDMDLSSSVNMIALAAGTFANPVETIPRDDGSRDVANYTYSKEDDSFVARWYAMGGEAGLDVWLIGRDIPDGSKLCGTPADCAASGVHSCGGVLGLVEDKEIVILACRGFVADKSPDLQNTYGSDPDDPAYNMANDAYALSRKVLTDVRQDPAGTEAEVAEYPDEWIALMVNNADFNAWLMAWTAKDFAEARDLAGLFGHLRANSKALSSIEDWLTDIPSYGQAIDDCANADSGGFVQWLAYYNDDALYRVLGARTEIAKLVQLARDLSAPAPEAAPAATSSPQPDQACSECEHMLSKHDPDAGCMECDCSYGASWRRDPGWSSIEETDALADPNACLNSGHDWGDHVPGVGCIKCDCTAAPSAGEDSA